MTRIQNYFIMALFMLSFASCINTKKALYFYNVPDTTFVQRTPDIETPIQFNDILGITVSSLSVEASAIFNPPNSNNARSSTLSGGNVEPGGYLVNDNGFIEFPVLGNIKAVGLTRDQLTQNITNLILEKKLLVDPLVNVRFLNYEVTVLGEVAKPTVITVPNEKISLLKAIGLAGDLTIYGRRDNVLLIRDEDGKKRTRHINLNSSDFFNSPYYYLHPNDVIYVQPNKAKVASGGRTEQLLPVILSALSVIVIVLDRVKF